MIVILFVSAVMAMPAFAAKDGQGNPIKGKEVSIAGKMTCTFCKLANPDKTCKPGCCEGCVRAGDPPLLTATDGNQYVLLTNEHEVSLMTPERYKMFNKPVNVQGVLVKGKGIQVIYVDKMELK